MGGHPALEGGLLRRPANSGAARSLRRPANSGAARSPRRRGTSCAALTLVACAVPGAAWLLVACAAPAQVRYEERVETATPAQEHGVHAERLAEVMRSLDRLANERLPKSMEVEWERERRVEELVIVAQAIADSAARIPAAPEGALLSTGERRAFSAHARALQERASRLAAEAAQLDTAATHTAVSEIRETCAACHRRFRGSGADEDREP